MREFAQISHTVDFSLLLRGFNLFLFNFPSGGGPTGHNRHIPPQGEPLKTTLGKRAHERVIGIRGGLNTRGPTEEHTPWGGGYITRAEEGRF